MVLNDGSLASPEALEIILISAAQTEKVLNYNERPTKN